MIIELIGKKIIKYIKFLKDVIIRFKIKNFAISNDPELINFREWKAIKEFLRVIFHDTDIKITIHEHNIKIPSTKNKFEIIHEYHSNVINGHRGVTKTFEKINETYYWKNMLNDVKNLFMFVYLLNKLSSQ